MLFAGHGKYPLPFTISCNVCLTSSCIFGIFLETTAHSLAATLGFLSVYDDIQAEVLEQIISVVGRDRDPVCYVFLFRML